MNYLSSSLKTVYSSLSSWLLTITIAVLVVLINYLTLIQTTTLEVFFASNIDIYNYSQIVLTFVIAILTGVSISFFVYILDTKRKNSSEGILGSFGSLLFSTAASGCTVCGAILLPALGIAASLTALPFAGLEIKILSILLLIYSLVSLAKSVSGACNSVPLLIYKKGYFTVNLTKETIRPFVVLVVFISIIYMLPKIPPRYRVSFARASAVSTADKAISPSSSDSDISNLLNEINPSEGYTLNVTYADLGPKLLSSGVIDFNKFKSVYDRSGKPLTAEQIKILKEGSDEKIQINPDNAYFLLNFFWALGLANKSKILTEGAITKYGDGQIGNFASTGGWSLTKSGNVLDYYAKSVILSLTPDQEALVERVSSNIYRPCCNNPTSFPDCNHGMALLAVLQVMAANGATEKEMYDASKYFNAYWFPSSYADLAMYFKYTENKSFKDIDSKTLLSKEYSSVSGWQNKKRWLQSNGKLKNNPVQGAGCGV